MPRNLTDPITGLHIPDSDSSYGYRPTEWITILFLVLFGLSTLIHVGQATLRRTWFMFPTAIFAGLLECAGWSARLWSALNLWNFSPFQLQIVATIIAPTPLVAADFIILGQIIRLLGSSYSRLSPKLYAIIFCCCDIVSLVVQGVGGGLASSEAGSGNPDTGGHIMLGGIVFQLVTISIYMILATEFIIRYTLDKPFQREDRNDSDSMESGHTYPTKRGRMTKEVKKMVGALIFNSICLYIRAIYRTIELSDGWSGRIITTQVYFNVLDGAMIVLAIYTLNFVHPSTLIRPHDYKDDLQHKRGGSDSNIMTETQL